jgi:hypothetical protein
MYLMIIGIWLLLIFVFEALYDYPRYIYGVNLGMSKTIFPIVWRFEPMADVYFGINLRGGENRKRLNP